MNHNLNANQNYSPEELLLAHIFGAFVLQKLMPDNTCEMKFVTNDGELLLRNNYETVTVNVRMGRYTPTRKFLNQVADTLAGDMIDYIKSGGRVKGINAKRIYDDSFS